MKISITGDVHLRAEHPERYEALENIFEQTEAAGIEHVIIAGDLFDEHLQNYSEFESLCGKHPDLQLHIIPGNHDPNIDERSITGENIRIYTAPTVVEIDSVTFLFIPFEAETTMGDKIEEQEHEIDGKQWALVGHGNFYGGMKERNPLEPGEFMPLSRTDLGRFKPQTVFLGHIHKPHSPANDVHYVGSPCGLDISETGRRRFLVYDTTDQSTEPRVIKTAVIYFTESFLVLPRDDEVARLEQEIADRTGSWEIAEDDHPKVRIRVEARGYAKDRSAILKALELGFGDFHYFHDEKPTIENLFVSSNDQLEAISERTMKLIEGLDWSFGEGDEPTREQAEIAALSVIYGDPDRP